MVQYDDVFFEKPVHKVLMVQPGKLKLPSKDQMAGLTSKSARYLESVWNENMMGNNSLAEELQARAG